jgi:uncharacterized protein (DUF885 family)
MTLGTTSILCVSLSALMMTVLPNIQGTNQTARSAEPVTSQKFAELSDQFMKESLALSPTAASSVGYHKHSDAKTGKTVWLDALLDDLSREGIAEQRAFYQQWRERFRRETPRSTLNLQDAADWQLIDDQIGLNLLEFDKIQTYRHNATVPVELIGNGLFLPLTQEYAPKEVRLGHVLSRVGEIPRLLNQVKQYMSDVDAIFVQTAIEENEGNIDMIENTIAREIPPGSPLKAKYDQVAPQAIAALRDFSKWLQEDLGKRPSRLTWRLGKEFYDQKFKLVMETDLTPEQLRADAVGELKAVRAEMLQLALPMHGKMYPNHGDHTEMTGRDRENLIIGEVLQKISDDHTKRGELMQTIQADLGMIEQFIREKEIVTLGSRSNLKVIPTPVFMRGIFSVAGFHSAPALEPQAEAEYWVTPIDPKMTDDQAESKLREYNNFALKWLTIHEALPGHYVQAEHANNIQPERRRLLRALFANGAYVEGWAEYVAQVMMDEGFLNSDPRFRMVMRKIRLRVVSNAILDIEMHTREMTDEKALELMTKEAFQTQAEAQGKLRRVKLSSTQLPTYYEGLREWLAFRKSYEVAAGENFNLRKFHDLALDQGALPVPVVERLLMPQPHP